MTNIILIVSIFLAFWMGTITIARVVNGFDVPAFNFVIFALGCTGVAAHFFGIY